MTMLKKCFALFFAIAVISSCEELFEVTDISGQQVQLLAPASQTIVSDSVVTFNWNEVFEADSYLVQIATPSFQNASQLVLDSLMVVDSTFISTRISKTLVNNNYEWRVKALNSDYETEFSSNTFTVLLQNTQNGTSLPNTPLLLAPENNSTVMDTNVSFSWQREDVASSQERDSIYIFQDEALNILETKGLGDEKAFSQALSVGTYHWYVRTYADGNLAGKASETFQFSIVEQ